MIRNVIEFLPAWILLKSLGMLPRRGAIFLGRLIARFSYHLHRRLTKTGERNLSMAMPELSGEERRAVVKRVFDNLGRQLGEFSQFPRITSQNIDRLVVYDGLENYQAASDKMKGSLVADGPSGRMGTLRFCSWSLWSPIELSGASAGQPAPEPTGGWVSPVIGERHHR
jgi:KDO2-lipid IV(A) lauroyltransferase